MAPAWNCGSSIATSIIRAPQSGPEQVAVLVPETLWALCSETDLLTINGGWGPGSGGVCGRMRRESGNTHCPSTWPELHRRRLVWCCCSGDWIWSSIGQHPWLVPASAHSCRPQIASAQIRDAQLAKTCSLEL